MIKNKNIEFSLLLLVILLFVYSYFSKLYFQLEHIDEVNYLADSILLFEGMVPSSKHAPSGFSTWIGTTYLIIEYIFQTINLKASSVSDLLNTYDYIIYKNYKDLTNIKISLLILNFSLLLYFLYKDKERIFVYIFLFIFTIFFLITFSFSGKPFFTASLFAALSLLIKKNNQKLSLIFFAFAIAENISFLVIIFYLLKDNENKLKISLILLPFIIFLAIAPWWSISLFQNLKIILHFLISSPNFTQNSFGNHLSFLSIFFYFFFMLALPLLSEIKLKLSLILIISLIIIFLILFQGFYLRWFLPFFLILSFEASKFNVASKFFFKIILLISILSNLIIFNLTDFKSDLEILNEEKNSNFKNILSSGLLIEELNFDKYLDIQLPYVTQYNSKNINYFNNEQAPLSFSEAGNLERSYIRRYEFLAKYDDNISKKNKFIRYETGLKSNIIYWCNKVDPENIFIIFKAKDPKTCDDFK